MIMSNSLFYYWMYMIMYAYVWLIHVASYNQNDSVHVPPWSQWLKART